MSSNISDDGGSPLLGWKLCEVRVLIEALLVLERFNSSTASSFLLYLAVMLAFPLDANPFTCAEQTLQFNKSSMHTGYIHMYVLL